MVGNECGGEDCCTSILVPGGTFPMGRSEDGADACPAGVDCIGHEQPEHPATVGAFYLDKYEVTVGRFRAFVEQFDGTPPPNGVGAHALIPESGWQSQWDSSLPSSYAILLEDLKCGAYWLTWTDTAEQNETYPITCVTWFEAFAFCAWDGGRLPTDAEWEFAAAGGTENRLYPWGSDDPSVNKGLANDSYNFSAPHVSVGSCPVGAARWGHQDLAGSMGEWVLDWRESDWYSSGGATCDNCANITPGTRRSLRGGAWSADTLTLRAAFIGGLDPSDRSYYRGFRCARTPQRAELSKQWAVQERRPWCRTRPP